MMVSVAMVRLKYCAGNNFTFTTDSIIVDINECTTSNGVCAQVCTNMEDGTFMCSCNSGFTLADDGFSCNGEIEMV